MIYFCIVTYKFLLFEIVFLICEKTLILQEKLAREQLMAFRISDWSSDFRPFQGPEKYFKKKVPGNFHIMAHFNPKF